MEFSTYCRLTIRPFFIHGPRGCCCGRVKSCARTILKLRETGSELSAVKSGRNLGKFPTAGGQSTNTPVLREAHQISGFI